MYCCLSYPSSLSQLPSPPERSLESTASSLRPGQASTCCSPGSRIPCPREPVTCPPPARSPVAPSGPSPSSSPRPQKKPKRATAQPFDQRIYLPLCSVLSCSLSLSTSTSYTDKSPNHTTAAAPHRRRRFFFPAPPPKRTAPRSSKFSSESFSIRLRPYPALAAVSSFPVYPPLAMASWLGYSLVALPLRVRRRRRSIPPAWLSAVPR